MYSKQIELLQHKNDILHEENKIYKDLINAEQSRKPALDIQISSMTNSLHVISDQKVELHNKVQDYGKMIKALTAENIEMKATNENSWCEFVTSYIPMPC